MTGQFQKSRQRLVAIARKLLPVTDSYGTKLSLRFMTFLLAMSFTATLVAGTVSVPGSV